jgi:hypothetical protein
MSEYSIRACPANKHLRDQLPSYKGLRWVDGGSLRRPTGAPSRPGLAPRAKPTSSYTREQLEAYYASESFVEAHEAGHALTAHLLGVPVRSVSVVGGIDGETTMGSGIDDDQTALMVLLAGWRAERLHARWIDDLDALWQRQHDRESVDERLLLMGLTRSDETFVREAMIEAVDELLERHGETLDRLHRVLVRDGTVMGARLAELLDWRPR